MHALRRDMEAICNGILAGTVCERVYVTHMLVVHFQNILLMTTATFRASRTQNPY